MNKDKVLESLLDEEIEYPQALFVFFVEGVLEGGSNLVLLFACFWR